MDIHVRNVFALFVILMLHNKGKLCHLMVDRVAGVFILLACQAHTFDEL